MLNKKDKYLKRNLKIIGALFVNFLIFATYVTWANLDSGYNNGAGFVP
ncbi:MAG: hypothetical protein ACI86M_000535 [Saprospiraceae bacterium]|jgi:hypothetical protein